MLTHIRVQGFKAIFDSGKVSFGPLTVLIGRNGSGKSSLIEALQWVQEACDLGLERATSVRFNTLDQLINRRAERREVFLELWEEGGLPSEVVYRLGVEPHQASGRPFVSHESCRRNRKRAALWDIQSRRGRKGPTFRYIRGESKVAANDRLALSQTSESRTASGAARLFHSLSRAAFLRMSPTAVAQRALPRTVAGAPLMDEQGLLTAARLLEMSPEQRERVARGVAEVLPGTRDVQVVENRESGTLFFQILERMRARGGRQEFEIPSWLLSEGARRLTTLFTLLESSPRPSLIAIEEIENGLDPWSLQIVFRKLREASESGVQIILTTHSPFLLDHVQTDEVLFVGRTDGETTYTPIENFDEVSKHKGLLAPGAMYLSKLMSGEQ